MRHRTQIVLENGRPSAVILDIAEYESLLDRAEDAEDLRTLRAMRKRTLHFRKVEDYLKERRTRV